MLFSIFFGAGNMIFPPLLGQQAGTQAPTALLGFIITDAGLAVLGIIAVVIAGNSMDSLVGKAGKKIGLVLTAAVYLLLGPLFALPRTGAVSFKTVLSPFWRRAAPSLCRCWCTQRSFLRSPTFSRSSPLRSSTSSASL